MNRTIRARTYSSWKKAIQVLLVCSLLLTMAACADRGPGSEDSPDPAGYQEAALAKVSQAVRVNLYEVTDNNFIQGIDEDYDGKVLRELQEAVKELSFAEDVSIPDDREGKYHIIFIDNDENYLLDIMVGEDGQAWCGDGVFQPSEALDDWMAARIEEEEESNG